MYPLADVEIDVSIPVDTDYWVPKPSDISEEGFGYFRDVWPLVDAPTKEVAALLACERRAAEYVANASKDVLSFDSLSKVIEDYLPDFDDREAEMPAELRDTWTGLGGLELGVSGLAHALSNAGFYPAASCRAHPDRSWTEMPVVLFASDRERLARLRPFLGTAGCGLTADATRGVPLFAVYAGSIVELMDLAEQLFNHRADFRSLPKTNRKQNNLAPPRLNQEPLF